MPSIYANSNADPTSAVVRSEVYPVPASIPAVTRGNKIEYSVYLVDGEGNFDSISGSAGYTLKIAIGPAGGPALASVQFTTQITNGWKGTLDLTGADVTNALSGKASIPTVWELQVTKDATSETRTYAQQEVTLLNKVN